MSGLVKERGCDVCMVTISPEEVRAPSRFLGACHPEQLLGTLNMAVRHSLAMDRTAGQQGDGQFRIPGRPPVRGLSVFEGRTTDQVLRSSA
jgi:hypothetical protein